MIAAANILTDLFLSCAAIIGLITLQLSLQRRGGWDPLTRRFLFAVRVTLFLFVGRALVVLTGGAGFRFVILLSAALIPLAVLMLTEGLLRRHAPRWIKGFVGAGTLIFLFLAFWSANLVDPTRLWALLAFQIAGLAASGWMVLTRDRRSLSSSENRTVGRLGMSLILLIPLIAADFLMVFIGLPVQISALGALVLCWLSIGLGRAQTGHGSTVTSFIVIVGMGVGAGVLVAVLSGTGRDGAILSVAVILAAMLVAAIINDARTLRDEERSHGLLQHLAAGTHDDPVLFLRELRDHPLVEGAVVIEENSLTDLDSAVLDRIFTLAPVLRRVDPPVLGSVGDDHIRHLFDRYAATHILQVSDDPRVLVALAMPAMGNSAFAELELRAVQRMAALIARAGRTE